MFEIIGTIIFGGVIGALARLVMKGDQNLGILWTIILGVVGVVVGNCTKPISCFSTDNYSHGFGTLSNYI